MDLEYACDCETCSELESPICFDDVRCDECAECVADKEAGKDREFDEKCALGYV